MEPFVTGSNRKISAYGELLFQAPEDNNLIDTPDFDKPVRGKRFIGKWFAGKVLPTDAQIFRTGGASVVLNAENESVGQYLPQLKSNAKYRLSYYIRTKDVKPLTKQDSGVYVRVELANGKARSSCPVHARTIKGQCHGHGRVLNSKHRRYGRKGHMSTSVSRCIKN